MTHDVFQLAGQPPNTAPFFLRHLPPPLSNASFLGPTRITYPNGISTRFCRAHERVQQTDTQTDHATPFITIDCMYRLLRCDLRSDAKYLEILY